MNTAAKKYTRALVAAIGQKDANKALEALQKLSSCFKDSVFSGIIGSPAVSKAKKEEFILSFLEGGKGVANEKIINFLRLLNQKNRLSEIPQICDELRRLISANKNEYELVVSSSFKLTKADLEHIKTQTAERLGVSLVVREKHSDIEGLKLFVDGIGVESSFLKGAFTNSLRGYILQAF